MPKYLVTLQSGRDFIMDIPINERDPAEQAMEVGYAAYEEAALMDDYLVDVELVYA
tara:strand:- start:269 stop:436 length:168 start_codon:yes stop_codon:yes gene_type:complete